MRVRALAHAAHNKASIYVGFMATALSGGGRGRVLCCHLDIVVQICRGEMQSIHVRTHTLNTAAGNTIASTRRVSADSSFLSLQSKKKKCLKKSSKRSHSLFFFFLSLFSFLSNRIVVSFSTFDANK